MNKYKFSLVYKILVYTVTVEASDENEANSLFNDKMSVQMFPTNDEIDELGNEFYACWDVSTVEAFCSNCGEIPESMGYTEEDLVEDYTVCPSGCYIAY